MSDEAAPRICPSCGAAFQGAYCHACGEKRLDPEDRTVRHFVADAFGTLTNVDGTLWRSFVLLVTRPGALTAAYVRGERKPYLAPFKIFLLCNLVYFFAQPFTGFTGYVTDLGSQRTRQVYSKAAHIDARVQARLGADTLSAEAYAQRYTRYAERFDARTSTYARTFIFVMIPLFALGLLLILPRRLFADHVVFATHFLAWHLLVVMSLYLLFYTHVLSGLVYDVFSPSLARDISEGSSILVVVPYLYLALRRAYAVSRVGAGWRTTVLLAPFVFGLPGLFLLAMYVHRFLLFWLAFWTTPVPGG